MRELTRSESLARYLDGFKIKCAEFGIDPAHAYVDMILKEAQNASQSAQSANAPVQPLVYETPEQYRSAKILGSFVNRLIKSPIPLINWLREAKAYALGQQWSPNEISPIKKEEEAKIKEPFKNTGVMYGGYNNIMRPVAGQINLRAISPYRYNPEKQNNR